MSTATENALKVARGNLEDARQTANFALSEVERCQRVIDQAREDMRQARQDLKAADKLVADNRETVHDLFEKHTKSLERAARLRAAKLACQYDIRVEDDADYHPGHPDYEFKRWVGCPEWIDEDNDPIIDGHFAHCWRDVLELVETYAMHHPAHPEHDEREFNVTGPCA